MPVKVALVGLGHMGKIHLQKLISLPDVDFLGAVDVDVEMAKPFCDERSVPFYRDFSLLLGTAQAVVVASPTQSHFHIASAFLRSGAHVFIEKPITANPEEAMELIAVAKEKDLILQVGHLERFNPAFRAAFPQIAKPVYIETHRLSPFPNRSIDIDVVLDLMIHDIDLVLALVRSPIKEIHAQGVPFLMNKFDAASARILFADGCVASLHASRVSVKRERSITIFEKEKYFVVDLLKSRLRVCLKGTAGALESHDYSIEKGDAVHQELTEFVTSIVTGKAPSVKGDDGLKALELANAITSYIARQKDA